MVIFMAIKMIQAAKRKLSCIKALDLLVKVHLSLTRKTKLLVRIHLKVM